MKRIFVFLLLISTVLILLFFLPKDWKNLKLSIPNKFTFVSSSSYRNQAGSGGTNNSVPEIEKRELVRISYVKQINSYNKYNELALYASLREGETLDITGWTVKANKGGFFVIPKAHDIYRFGSSEQDILLRGYDKVVMYSFPGLIGNLSLNKCTGYLETALSFNPPLPKDCPRVDRSQISSFSGRCQDYINSLNTCQVPSDNPPVPYDDGVCRDFLRKMNYDSCVNEYKNDKDFRSNEWRLWIGPTMNIFDEFHDKIRIYNKSGDLMTEYTY